MLSRNDIAKLRRLIQRVDALESMIQSQAFNTHRGGPAYLVKAPEGGIPAMVGNTPGFASCDMVRLWSDDLPADKKLADLGTRQPVRNLGEEIPAGEIAIAHRDGFGDLFISAARGNADFEECSGGGLTIPGLAESPIVSAVDADYIVGIRDGCTVLVEVETCETESSEPPSVSGSVPPSEPPISEPPTESEPPISEDPEDPPTEPEEPL